MQLADLIDTIYELNVGVIGRGEDRHERPHKPALLLAALDRMDAGAPTHEVEWSRELRAEFKRVFEVVRARDDRANPNLPFFHLRSDGFWAPVRRDEMGEHMLAREPRVRDEGAVFAVLPPKVARLLSDPGARGALRDAIIARYFPTSRADLRRPSAAPLLVEDAGADQSRPGRSAAFRRKVVDVYDHQCAACGLRLRPGDIPVSLVDAAHIVPFARSGDDHPRNGMALCKNHHWAMDQRLIAPTPGGVWRSSPALVPRRSSGEAELASLDGQRLLSPRESAYRPRPEALAWRLKRLLPAG